MKTTLIKRMLMTAAIISGVVLSTAAWSATATFTGTYKGASTSGGSCGTNYNISGVEPTTGTHPVFVYMVGTTETYNNASAMAAVNAMAAKGHVSAAIAYASGSFGSCSQIKDKTSCAFDPNSTTSAIKQLCSRATADCSKGIVVAGFSQGSVIAIQAKNYDARVQAAWGMGVSDHYTTTYNLSSCNDNGNHTLPSDRLRATDGQGDAFAGTASGFGTGTQPVTQNSLTAVTGLTCAAGSYSCLRSNGSGWAMARSSQVNDLSADHCYMRATGDCLGSESLLDSGWKTGTSAWAMGPSLNWLAGFTTP